MICLALECVVFVVCFVNVCVSSLPLFVFRFIERNGLVTLRGWLQDATHKFEVALILAVFQMLGHLPISTKALEMSSLERAVFALTIHVSVPVSQAAKRLLSKWKQVLEESSRDSTQ